MVPDWEEPESSQRDHDLKTVQPCQTLRKPVKPYVSSTQGDFSEERQFLRETIFPQVDAVCKQRGTYFSPTNIEWTASHQHISAGTALTLALDLVSRSSPFLICMIGERYGEYRPEGSPALPKSVKDLPPDADWLDQNYMVAASAGYTWLLGEAHQNCSFLELEVMQAAFLNDNDHCLFYFRQPEHVDDKFLNMSTQRREKKIGKYLAEDEESRLRVRDLKQRIIKKGLAVKYFRSLEDLGNSILDDWINVLDMLYPPLKDAFVNIDTEEFADWTSREMYAETRRNTYLGSSQIAGVMEKLGDFALSCLQEVHMQKQETAVLDQYQAYSVSSYLRRKKGEDVSHQSILVLTGDRGSGKSSLISNWLDTFEEDNPHIKVITAYIGSSCWSTDITVFMRRCMWELRKHYMLKDFTKKADISAYETTGYGDTVESFLAALSLGPCVLVLDGVDRLCGTLGQTVQQIKELSWLPQPLPSQCKVILTCVRSDLMFKSLQSRSDVQIVTCPVVETLDTCAKYLQEYTLSTFSHVQRRHLLKIWECSPKLRTRPLFLSLVACELRCFEVYSDLDPYVENLSEMVGIREYWSRCLHRWLQIYSWTLEQFSAATDTTSTTTEGFALVGWIADALRLIAVSRFGLSQSELLALLKRIGYSGRAEVKEFDWLLFRECLGESLYEGHRGLLNFSHHHLRDCIEYNLLGCVRPGSGETMSLCTPLKEWQKDKTVFHMCLANYFSSHPCLQRRVEELPWQLIMAREARALERVLSTPDMFLTLADEERLWPSRRQDLRLYWSLLKETGILPSQCYLKMLSHVGLDVQADDQQLNDSSINTSLSSIEKLHMKDPPKIVTESPTDQHDINHEGLPQETPDSSFMTFITESDRDVKMSKMKWLENDHTVDITHVVKMDSHSQNKGMDLVDNSTEGPEKLEKLAWSVAGFLSEQGETIAVEKVLVALHNHLISNSCLNREQQLLLSQVQEKLGGIYMLCGDRELGETLYRKSTRSVTDIGEDDATTETDFSRSVLNLKGKVLAHHGEMMLRDGFDEDAEEFLEEAQECLEVADDIVGQSMILYQMGTLKIHQEDFHDAELHFRHSLALREKWFGHSHPVVAETVFMLAHLMSLHNNKTGYNKLLSETLYRRALAIREKCLGVNHPLVATTLLHLGKLLQCDAGLSVKSEVIRLMRRGLDIRTTHFGSKHPDTKQARQCLHEVEVSVQLGQYEFGPAKPVDKRTLQRPYSSLSWREHELKDKQVRAHSAKHSPSQRSPAKRTSQSSPARPQSSICSLRRETSAISRQSSCSPKKSEGKTSLKPQNGLNSKPPQCEVTPLQLQPSVMPVGKIKPEKHSSPSLESVHSTDFSVSRQNKPLKLDIRMTTEDLVSGAEGEPAHIPEDEDIPVAFTKKKVQTIRPLSGPARLYHRYSNTIDNHPGRSSSAIEPRSGMHAPRSPLRTTSYTSFSGYSGRSRLKETQLAPMNTSSVYSLGGPNSSLSSLLIGTKTPQDFQKQTHHRSTWFHVPGRYITSVERVPRKRSQLQKRSLSARHRNGNISQHASPEDNVRQVQDVTKLDDLEFENENTELLCTQEISTQSPTPAGNVVTFTEAVIVG